MTSNTGYDIALIISHVKGTSVYILLCRLHLGLLNHFPDSSTTSAITLCSVLVPSHFLKISISVPFSFDMLRPLYHIRPRDEVILEGDIDWGGSPIFLQSVCQLGEFRHTSIQRQRSLIRLESECP